MIVFVLCEVGLTELVVELRKTNIRIKQSYDKARKCGRYFEKRVFEAG